MNQKSPCFACERLHKSKESCSITCSKLHKLQAEMMKNEISSVTVRFDKTISRHIIAEKKLKMQTARQRSALMSPPIEPQHRKRRNILAGLLRQKGTYNMCAAATGISKTTISNLVTGLREINSFGSDKLANLARYLGITKKKLKEMLK